MTRTIIDMRSRPAFLHDFYGATPGTREYETARFLNRRTGSKDIEHFVRSHTMDGYLDEIRDAGIATAVVVGRLTPAIRIGNEEIHRIVSPHPELLGIGSIDPQATPAAEIPERIRVAIEDFGLKGINIEPGFGSPPYTADSPLLNVVYESCQALDVPVFIMSGPTSPSLALTDPKHIGHVARDFPALKIVCFHGCYPYVNEIIGVAFRHANLFIVPDMYTFLPGGQLYIEAAKGCLSEQILFGTSYPFRAMRQTVDDFLQLGLGEDALERVLHGNAKALLKL